MQQQWDITEITSLFKAPRVRALGGNTLFLLRTRPQEKSLMNRKQKEYTKISELSVNCFTFKHNQTLTMFERGRQVKASVHKENL